MSLHPPYEPGPWITNDIRRLIPVALLCLLLWPFLCRSSEINFLPNGSFERTSTGGIPDTWSRMNSAGTITVVARADTRCGDYVLRLIDSSNTQSVGLRSASVPVAPGTTYQAEGYASCDQATATGQIFLKFYDSDGQEVGSSSATLTNAVGTWGYLSVSGTAPPGATRVNVLCYSTIGSIGTIHFDGISLRALANPLPDQMILHVSPSGSGSGTGLDWPNAAKYNNATFWSAAARMLDTNSVKVIFAEGEYLIEKAADTLRLASLGNESNSLILEGEHPFGSVFTRTDAAQTNELGPMLNLQYVTNVVVRHLHWENDTKLSGRLVQYCLAIRSAATGSACRNVRVQGCSFVGLSWNIYGAMGFHNAQTFGGEVVNCEFIRGGFSAGFHMIYNAYGSYDLRFENNYFQDCTGSYLRLRGGCHEALVISNEFRSTSAVYNQAFIHMPTFNNIDPGDETWGYNYKFIGNTFNYSFSGGNNVPVQFTHSGFDPARAPGVLWDYLLNTNEAAILTSGTVAARKELLRTNFGINFDTQLVMQDNIHLGQHARAMQLGTQSTPSYNYQDEGGVWHICPDYGGNGTWDISDLSSGPAMLSTNSWARTLSAEWDSPANWTPKGVPNGIGSVALVTNSIAAVTRTNTINSDVTLGRLELGAVNGATNFVLVASRNSSLTFDNGGTGAQLISTTGHESDSINAPVKLGDDLNIHNTKTLLLRGAIYELGSYSGYGQPRFITKTGGGLLALTASNSFSGGVVLQSGSLHLGNNSALGCGPLTIMGGSFASADATARTLSNPLFVSNSFVLGQAAGGSGELTFSGTVDLGSGARMITVSNAHSIFSGSVIGQGGGLTKAGLGSLTLNGFNTYTGPTIVTNGGTLFVEGSLASSSVTARSGTTLAGNGVIAGAVAVSSGATLAPGRAGIGLLTVSNVLTLASGSTTLMQISGSLNTNDTVQRMTLLNYGGTLSVVNVGANLSGGRTFRLFSASSYAGQFSATNLPPLSEGLKWIWMPNSGVLVVSGGIPSTPTNLSIALVGAGIELSWPASHLGWQAQSNSIDMANPAHWHTISGSEAATQLTVPVAQTSPPVFYRLRYP